MKEVLSRRSLLALIFAIVLMSSGAAAEEPPPGPTPQPALSPPAAGDILWTFAREPVLNDARIAQAVATKVDREFRPVNARVFYAQPNGPDFVVFTDRPPAREDDVPRLMAAAGLPGGLSAAPVTGPCGIWVAPGASDQAMAAARNVGTVVIGALKSLGAGIAGSCLPVEDISEADVIVWVHGGPVPGIPTRVRGMLGLPGPTGVPAAGGQQAQPVPPRTGDAGLKR
jgi:hypothetical protein